MRVSQVNDKPVPMEIPVTLTTCNLKRRRRHKSNINRQMIQMPELTDLDTQYEHRLDLSQLPHRN